MKILVTGYYSRLCGLRDAAKLKHNTTALTFVDTMKSMGHNVDEKQISPGDNFDEYDKVFVFIARIEEIYSRHAAGALYVLGQRPDAIIVFTNMNKDFNTYLHGLKLKLKSPNFIFRSKGYFYKDAIWREPKWTNLLREVVEEYSQGDWKNTVLFPGVVRNSNRHLFKDTCISSKIHRFDTSCHWWNTYNDVRFSWDKKREWVLSAMWNPGKWIEKQNLTWPSIFVGDKTSAVGRIPEDELVAYHSKRRGMLINPYKVPSIGLLRYKFVVVAKYGLIPYGSREELEIVGPTWGWCADNLEKIENATDDYLDNISMELKTEYLQGMWSLDKLKQFVSSILRGAIK